MMIVEQTRFISFKFFNVSPRSTFTKSRHLRKSVAILSLHLADRFRSGKLYANLRLGEWKEVNVDLYILLETVTRANFLMVIFLDNTFLVLKTLYFLLCFKRL